MREQKLNKGRSRVQRVKSKGGRGERREGGAGRFVRTGHHDDDDSSDHRQIFNPVRFSFDRTKRGRGGEGRMTKTAPAVGRRWG